MSWCCVPLVLQVYLYIASRTQIYSGAPRRAPGRLQETCQWRGPAPHRTVLQGRNRRDERSTRNSYIRAFYCDYRDRYWQCQLQKGRLSPRRLLATAREGFCPTALILSCLTSLFVDCDEP